MDERGMGWWVVSGGWLVVGGSLGSGGHQLVWSDDVNVWRLFPAPPALGPAEAVPVSAPFSLPALQREIMLTAPKRMLHTYTYTCHRRMGQMCVCVGV